MSKTKIPGGLPPEKKPEIRRDPESPGDEHEPEIPDVPRQKPDVEPPPPDKPEIDRNA
jgi:hypothetical protein